MKQNIFSSHRTLWLLLACLVLCVLNIIAYQPGFATTDTIQQYQQALENKYEDWHPPVMAMLWHLLLKIQDGLLPMMVLQMLLLWGSVFVLLTSNGTRWWYILIAMFPFLPFIQNFPGYVIKDSQMALSFLLVAALIYRAYSRDRKLSIVELVLTVALIIYGGIVRPNALPAVIPLCVVIAILQTGGNKWKTVLVSVVLIGAVIFANNIQYSGNVKKTFPTAKLYLHDLQGIFVETGESVFPPSLYSYTGFDTVLLREKYEAATFDHIWWKYENQKEVVPPITVAVNDSLKQYWKDAIAEHPLAYLEHRFKSYLCFLRIHQRYKDFIFHVIITDIPPNDSGLKFHRTFLTWVFQNPIEAQANMPYMRPWFWGLCNIVLLILWKRVLPRLRPLYFALLISSLLYLLPYLFLSQVDIDFRYVYWNCIACSLALIILVENRLKRKQKSLLVQALQKKK